MGMLGNAYYFQDVHGCDRCIRGLPLSKRSRWLQLFIEFRALALVSKDKQFWQLYDPALPEGRRNPDHVPRFRQLADQLLMLHNIEPSWVSADMAASLLLSDGDSVGILEQIEFPRRDDTEDGEPVDPDIDPDAQFLATLATHVGGLQQAIELAAKEPQVELVELMRANSRVQDKIAAEAKRDRTPDSKSKPASKPKSKKAASKLTRSQQQIISDMREQFERDQQKIMLGAERMRATGAGGGSANNG